MQSKAASIAEAVVNTAVGCAIAFIAQSTIAWFYDMHLSPNDNVRLVFWMTLLSVARSYVIRRLWNGAWRSAKYR